MGTVIGWVRTLCIFMIDLPAPQLPSLHLCVSPFPRSPHSQVGQQGHCCQGEKGGVWERAQQLQTTSTVNTNTLCMSTSTNAALFPPRRRTRATAGHAGRFLPQGRSSPHLQSRTSSRFLLTLASSSSSTATTPISAAVVASWTTHFFGRRRREDSAR